MTRSTKTFVGFATVGLLAGLSRGETAPPPKGPPEGPLETGTTPPVKPAPVHHERSVPAISTMDQPGGFNSVQVNVNAQGMNIVGDAANEPSLAVDPTDPDNVAVGWRQFDTINSDFREAGFSSTQDGGATWTAGVIDNGIFRSDPVLFSDAQGIFFYYSLYTDLGNDWRCDLFKSTDSGLSWGAPVFAFGGDKAWPAMDTTGGTGDGHIYTAWNVAGNEYFPATFNRSINAGSSFQNPLELPQRPKFGSVAVGPDSELYVIGVNGSGQFYVIRSDNARNSGQSPTFNQVTFVNLNGTQRLGAGPNPSGLLGQAWVAVDHSDGPSRGYVYALCSVNPPGSDPLDVYFARSTNGGASFSAPIRINDDASTSAWQWFGTMSVAPNGRIDVVWNDTRNDGSTTFSELYYAYSTDNGLSFSENIAVSPPYNHFLGYPQNNKLGDYYDMISFDDGAHVAWAATFNGEQDVYYLYIPSQATNTVRPSGFDVPFGRFQSGTTADLHESDDSYVVIEQRPAASVLLPLIRLDVSGTAAGDGAAQMVVTVEAAATALPGLPPQRLSLFNYDTSNYEIVDERTATPADSVVEVAINTNAGRFVQAGTAAVAMRIDWFDPGNVFSPAWGSRTDQAIWAITP